MCRARHVISIVHVVNVNLIAIAPTWRKRSANHEPVATILETRMAGHDHRMLDAEPVHGAKISNVMLLTNVVTVVAFGPFLVLVTLVRPITAFPPLVAAVVFVPLVDFVPDAVFVMAAVVAVIAVVMVAAALALGFVLVLLVPGIAIIIV